MMIVLVFASAIAVFLASMFSHRWRSVWLTLAGIVFVLSVGIVTLNYSHHFGMKKVTTTSSKVIYSATSKQALPVILYQPVGTSGKDDVYLYNQQPNQKQPSHTQASEQTQNQLRRVNGDQVRLVTKETHWQYANGWSRLLFAGSGMDNKLVKRVNTFYYPSYYVKVSTKQIKQLAQRMPKQKTGANKAAADSSLNGKQSQLMKVKAQMLKQALK